MTRVYLFTKLLQEADCIQQLNKADPLHVSRTVQLFVSHECTVTISITPPFWYHMKNHEEENLFKSQELYKLVIIS